MRALVLDYQQRSLAMREVPDPALNAPGDVLLRVLEVGICGTDRDLARFHFGYPPKGMPYLILGHEALAEVIAVGSAVHTLQPGDLVAPLIRRPCPDPCVWCRSRRPDLCVTGRYTERGIMGAHGYFSQYAVDQEENLVRLPPEAATVGVLFEPLSVAEKAVDTAVQLHRGEPKTALIVGAGTIGLLCALAAQARNLNVTVFSLEDPGSNRAQLARQAGLHYTTQIQGTYDLTVEAAGSPTAFQAALEALAPLGVLVALGAASSGQPIDTRRLILKSQIVASSINTSPAAARRAATHLVDFDHSVLESLIERRQPEQAADSIFAGAGGRPKVVHPLWSV
jgi:threonine dehydrogenase-like Zn-dependent dehydrogenase